MFKRLFGKRDDAAPMPWEPEGGVAAACAIGNLIDYLLNDLKGPKGIHVQSLMTTIGALAGFSAQHAIWETIIRTGKLAAHDGEGRKRGAFVLAQTETDEKFYFGDLLDSYLIPRQVALGPGPHTLWNLLAATVESCGGRPLPLREIEEIFRNAAATFGSPRFGVPRLPPGDMPAMTPRQALNRAWPKARVILGRSYARTALVKSLPLAYWPTAVAVAAQKLLIIATCTLDPALAMRIVFEAAVPMSKIDPETVP